MPGMRGAAGAVSNIDHCCSSLTAQLLGSMHTLDEVACKSLQHLRDTAQDMHKSGLATAVQQRAAVNESVFTQLLLQNEVLSKWLHDPVRMQAKSAAEA